MRWPHPIPVFMRVAFLTGWLLVSCSSSDGRHNSGGGGEGGMSGSAGADASPTSGGTNSSGGSTTGSGGSTSGSGGGAMSDASGCVGECVTDCVQGCFDFGDCVPTGEGSVDVEPNVMTAGVVLTMASAPQTAEVYYRPSGSTTWWKGHTMVRIPDGRVAGSLFDLSPSTDYEIRVQAGASIVCGTTSTEPETPAAQTSNELWVDAAASGGGTGSESSPFANIATAVADAGAGTDIHVRPGVYREALVITQSGSSGAYVRILGEPGAILDGSSANTGPSWSAEGAGVWSTPWSGDPRYVSRDGVRLYHYLSLADLSAGTGMNGVSIAEGFFVESGKLFVRASDDPSGHTFQIPTLNTAIQVSGASHVWIEGLEIRFYGEGDYAKGIDVTGGSTDVVIRANHIHDIPSLVWIRNESAQVRIEDSELHQSSVFGWPWEAVKATDHENDAVSLQGGRGAIVTRNVIHDIFNGVYAGSFDDDQNPDLAFDVDVYQNRLARIGDDGFEPEGAGVNERFWANAVDGVHNGVSLAPITFGPTWVIRNRFTSFRESGFKVSNGSSGRVWLLHNTCYTDEPDHNGMNVSGPFENIVFRNNVIRGTLYAIESTQIVSTNDLDYDALFTTRGAPRVKWNDVRYDDLAALCAATGLECHGVGDDPALADPANLRFAPTAMSPLVDKGVRLYGINDEYSGAAPDIGYVEVGTTEVAGVP